MRKDIIFEEWILNGIGSYKKNNNEKFEKVNYFFWEWYVKIRGVNILVDGLFFKEEVCLIEE